MLLDTGSQVNVLPKKCLTASELNKLEPSDLDLKSYSGNKIEVLGLLKMNISMGSIELRNVVFYIVSDLLKPILGTPALENNRIAICFSQNKLIQNGTKYADLITNNDEKIKNFNLNLVTVEKKLKNHVLQLEASERYEIQANSERIIKCQARYPVLVAGDYAVEIESANTKLDVLFGKSVSTFSAESNTCLLRMCNATDVTVVVPVKTRLINAVQVTVQTRDYKQPVFTTERIEKILSDVKINSKNQEIRAQAKTLVQKFHDVFATDDDNLGETNAVEYDIDTGNSAPQAQQRYRTPFYLRNEMNKIIKKNVSSGLMSPTSSPWAAPVLLVKKANGSWRLVCDYRKLNTVTVSDSYPLPEINDLVTELAESKIISISDM